MVRLNEHDCLIGEKDEIAYYKYQTGSVTGSEFLFPREFFRSGSMAERKGLKPQKGNIKINFNMLGWLRLRRPVETVIVSTCVVHVHS